MEQLIEFADSTTRAFRQRNDAILLSIFEARRQKLESDVEFEPPRESHR